MPDFEINDLHTVGMIADIPPYQLPPEAWSLAQGVRYKDQTTLRLAGWAQVFGTPTVVPHFLLGVLDANRGAWWIYTSLTKAYVFQGSTHMDITRAAGDYTAAASEDWGGTVLAGIPILNNNADVPQFWASYSAATDLQNLTNWPATLRAKQVIAFGPFLFALNCTKSGTNHPHLVKWSHPAAPGALPVSWDETDLTRDTGEYEIPSDAPGGIMGGLALHDHLYIYKEGVVWRTRYIGGRAVFFFQAFLNTMGAISRRAMCVTPDGSGHVFVANNDIMLHNGQQASSVIDKRVRKEFFDRLNPDHRGKVFCFANRKFNEIWICIPEVGSTECNTAFIWNMTDNAWSIVEGINFRAAALGPVESTSTDTWATVSGTWATIAYTWGQVVSDSVVLASTDNTKLALLDSGDTRLGSTLNTIIRRSGLSFIGRTRHGDTIVDFKRRKLFTRVWIKGAGNFKVRVGSQEEVNDAVSWSEYQSFDPEVDVYLDFTENGRALAVEFSNDGDGSFAITGYKVELSLLGNY